MSSAMDLSPREQRLNEILASYFEAVESGQTLTPRDLIDRYPDLAVDLEKFFHGHRDLDRLAAPVRGTESNEPAAQCFEATPTRVHPSDPTPSADRPDRIGDYDILEEIAQGGMGVVYKAKQRSVGRIVALKMILRGRVTREDLTRFRLEAEAAANLDHPNIVPVYEVGESDGQPYFTMKLIEGGNLSHALAQGSLSDRSKSRNEAVRLIATVARAVHFAHQRGILHRDLKPGNILLSGQGSVASVQPENRKARSSLATSHESLATGDVVPFVTDFGLAKRLDHDVTLTESGAVVGTPAFMAPEQALGSKQITTAADIYSLGAILYLALTGQKVFAVDAPAAALLMLQHEDPVRPTAIDRGIPGDLETICLMCLEKAPAKRYATAEALAEDLERFLAGEPIAARAVGPVERLRRWVRRRPAIAGLLVLLAVSVVAGFTGVTLQWLEADRLRAIADRERGESETARTSLAEALQATEQATYFYQVGAALGDYRFSPDAALEILDRCEPQRRGWEWHSVRRNCTLMPLVLRGKAALRSLSPQPGGDLILATSEKGTSVLWDSRTGRRVADVGAIVNKPVQDACFAGRSEIVVLAEQTLNRIPLDDLRVVESLPAKGVSAVISAGEGFVAVEKSAWRQWNSARQSSDRRETSANITGVSAGAGMLAVGLADGTIQVIEGSKSPREWRVPGFRCLAACPDGRLVATATEKGISLWDSASCECLRHIQTTTLGHATNMVFTPDSTRLIAASETGLRLWSVEAPQPLNLYLISGGTSVMAMSDSGTLNWETRSSEILVLRTATQPKPLTVPLRGEWLAFSGDGDTLAVASEREVHLVATSTGRTLTTLTMGGEVSQVQLSQDASRLAVLTPSQIGVWTRDGKNVIEAATTFRPFALSPDGTWCAWSDREGIKLWREGEKVKALTAERPTALAADQAGKKLAATFWADEKIQLAVFDTTTGEISRRKDEFKPREGESPSPVICLAFDQKAPTLYSVTQNRVMMTWANPVAHVKSVRVADRGPFVNRFTPDGSFLAWIDPKGHRYAKIQYTDSGSDRITLRQRLDDDFSGMAIGPQASVFAWPTKDNQIRILRLAD